MLAYRTSVHDFSRDLEADGIDLLASVGEHGLTALRGSSSTAHVSAVDDLGNACAITMSSGYGAGMTIPGTGILLNNALGEVELNRLGLHAMAPGTRLASNMAPTTGRTRDGRALAIGSPGADRITTALMLVLGQGCLHGADLQDAIANPGCTCAWVPTSDFRVEYERDDAIAAAVAAAPGWRATSTPSRTCTSAGWAPPTAAPDGAPAGGRRRAPRGRGGCIRLDPCLPGRPLGAQRVHLGHRGAQLVEPLLGVLADQPDRPGQRVGAGPGHPGVHQGVEDLALGLTQPGHHRHGQVGEQGLGVTVPDAPRDLAAVACLGLAGDLDAPLAGVGAEPADPALRGGALDGLGRRRACRPP